MVKQYFTTKLLRHKVVNFLIFSFNNCNLLKNKLDLLLFIKLQTLIMKKNYLLLLLFLFSIIGYSQNPLEKIKNYLNENRSKIQVQPNDISDLVIVNDFSSESTGINNYHVKQRYQGIEIYNSDSNFWIKDDKVINGGDEFINNISQKINTVTPNLSVINAFSQVLTKLNENVFTAQIIDSQGNNYKLTNGALTDDPAKAKLNYILTGVNTLRLAWSFEFYTQDTNHLWSIDIDAVDGKQARRTDNCSSLG